MESVREQFRSACVLMNVPVNCGADMGGVVDAVRLSDSIPDGTVMNPAEIHQKIVAAAVEADDDLMAQYFEKGTISLDDVDRAILKSVIAGTLIPVFCTAVKKDIGISELMNGIAAYAPSPEQLKRRVTVAGEDLEIKPRLDGPLIGQIVKTRIDPYISKVSYIRLYSGTLRKDDRVHIVVESGTVKISQLLEFQGGEREQIEEATAANIVAVAKVDELHTGTTISDGSDEIRMPPIAFPRPMVGLAVEPRSQADQTKISNALQKMEEEDPSFHVHRDEQTHVMVMEDMRELHLREFYFDENLEFCFVDRISGGSVPNQFIPAVEKGFREQMRRGVIAGYQVQSVIVELFFGKFHSVDSNETAFRTATAHCFRDLFVQALPAILEPMVSLEVTVPGDRIGDITSDLNTRRGQMIGVEEISSDFRTIRAKAPLANLMAYARTVSSLTGGQGSFTMDFSSHEFVPPNTHAAIVVAAANGRKSSAK